MLESRTKDVVFEEKEDLNSLGTDGKMEMAGVRLCDRFPKTIVKWMNNEVR